MGLLLIGMVLIVMGTFGAFGKMNLGSYTWICLILGIVFFPSGIGLMKSTRET